MNPAAVSADARANRDDGSGTGVPVKNAFTEADPVYQVPANPDPESGSNVIGVVLTFRP